MDEYDQSEEAEQSHDETDDRMPLFVILTSIGLHFDDSDSLVKGECYMSIYAIIHCSQYMHFICRWYNLNSTLDQPEYVSETYLSLLIDEYQNRGMIYLHCHECIKQDSLE